MIKLNIEPYCENCEAFDPDTIITKETFEHYDEITRKKEMKTNISTKVYCKMQNICNCIHRYIVKEELKANGQHN